MAYLTAERLLIIAIVVTLVCADGAYRAWKQRVDDDIGPRLFVAYIVALVVGGSLAWIGFFIEWSAG